MGTVNKTRGIILNAIRWKESSKIISVYSEDFGKIKLIARSALRKNSPLAGKIETLFFIEMVIDEKKTRTLNILREVDVLNTFSEIRMDMALFPYGLTLLEIVNQIFDDISPDPVFFGFTLEMLTALSRKASGNVLLIYFLLKLASYLGFKPSLDTCISGDLELCRQKVFLSMSEGNMSCKFCSKSAINIIPFTKEQFLFLRELQKVQYKQVVNIKESPADSMQIIQKLLRFTNFHIEKDLKIQSLNLINPNYI